MTVAELQAELAKYPPDLKVAICNNDPQDPIYYPPLLFFWEAAEDRRAFLEIETDDSDGEEEL